MTNTAPLRKQLAPLNCRYLFLLGEIKREGDMFHYPSRQIRECKEIRDAIVELQNTIKISNRKVVNAQ